MVRAYKLTECPILKKLPDEKGIDFFPFFSGFILGIYRFKLIISLITTLLLDTATDTYLFSTDSSHYHHDQAYSEHVPYLSYCLIIILSRARDIFKLSSQSLRTNMIRYYWMHNNGSTSDYIMMRKAI